MNLQQQQQKSVHTCRACNHTKLYTNFVQNYIIYCKILQNLENLYKKCQKYAKINKNKFNIKK